MKKMKNKTISMTKVLINRLHLKCIFVKFKLFLDNYKVIITENYSG